MTPEQKLEALSDYFADISYHLDRLSDEFKNLACLLSESDGEKKQRNVSESLRRDAIDELLKREGLAW